jgi:uncharacterized SAM-binding protein YcdF (DUF218 family)
MSSTADAVVVLGAQVLGPEAPTTAVRRRVVHAVGVMKASEVGHLVACGGVGEAGVSEASVMRHLAIGLGVDPERIIVEETSTNTFEHAVEVGGIAHGRGWSSLVIVTDRFHSPRARFLFRRLGLEISGDPVPDRAGGSRLRWLAGYLREAGAWTKLVGWAVAGRLRRLSGAA